MSGDALPHAAWGAARRRDAAIVAAFTLPWLLALTTLAARVDHTGAIVAVAAVLGIGVAAWRWRQRHALWLVRELNTQRADMEDSADLLLAGRAHSALQMLQRERLQQRLNAHPADLRTAWPLRALGVSLLLAMLVSAAAVLWPARQGAAPVPVVDTSVESGPIRVVAHAIDIAAPSYTQLPARSETALSVKAPQGSQLRWRLRFSSVPASAVLVLLDGRRIDLARDGEDWIAALQFDASALYRIEVDGIEQESKPQRLDAIADRPPQIKVLAPERSLNLVAPGQRSWDVLFEVNDDYGVAEQARLDITLAQGSGENVRVQERSIVIRGTGERTRRFAHRLDLSAQGMAVGDDLIVRLTVSDNRNPQPQSTRSPSLILRWQVEADHEGAGVEAAVKRVLPAYFRSQRQIIIDAETLQKQKRRLDNTVFLERSDTIGVDQRILRLRYGQFLGEEADGAPKADGDADHEESPTPLDSNTDLTEAFGHTHDNAEAATLLDPQTRATLKKALDRMWQSELELRQGRPDRALPHAYQALDFIKQVQQANRIYLARVGTDLPPIDETRRLGGKREGIASRPDALRPASTDDADIATLWRALGEAGPSFDLATLQRWLREHAARVTDPLALQAAIDVLQRQPECNECRNELRAQLWSLLSRPPAFVPRRPATDVQGRRYLDGLDEPGAETRP